MNRTSLTRRIALVSVGTLAILGGCGKDNRPALATLKSSEQLDRSRWRASGVPSSDTDVPALAIDNDITTRWSTGVPMAGNEFFSVDMIDPQTFDRIEMDSATSLGDYARAYRVYVSQNGTSWGTGIISGTGSSELISVSFPMQTARFVGVLQTGTSDHWWSIHELNVFSPACIPEDDGTFCSRLGASCGTLVGIDNCGNERTVTNCGTCTPPAACGGGIATESPTGNDPRPGSYGPASDTYALGMQFTTNTAGTITGLRLQAPAGASHVLKLWNASTGSLLASATVVGAGSNVWVNGAVNVPTRAGGSYIVSYYTGCYKWYFDVGTCPSGVTRGNILIEGCPYANGDSMPTITSPNLRAVDVAFSVSATPNLCTTCAPEDNPTFCRRLERNCGSVSGTDNCGNQRDATCGGCTSPSYCSSTNVCTCSLTCPNPTAAPSGVPTVVGQGPLVRGGSYRYLYTYFFGTIETLPSPASDVVVPLPYYSGGAGPVVVQIPNSNSPNVGIMIYRTTNGGSTFYRAGAMTNHPGQGPSGFWDNYWTDGSIVNNPRAPTASSFCGTQGPITCTSPAYCSTTTGGCACTLTCQNPTTAPTGTPTVVGWAPLVPGGSYRYVYTYAAGEIETLPSPVSDVVHPLPYPSGGAGTVVVTVRNSTNPNAGTILIYRTTNGGSTFYRAGALANNPSGGTADFRDYYWSDGSIVANAQPSPASTFCP